MLPMRRYCIAALLALLAATISGCVEGGGPFFDKASGLIDSYFEGTFSYVSGPSAPRRVQLVRKGKLYRVEDDGKLLGFASIHNFRQGFLIAQLQREPTVGLRYPYLYFLVRKTPSGFEVSGSCSKVEGTCEAKNKSDLISKLDRQAKSPAHPEKWIELRRGWPRPGGEAVSESSDPTEDCNSNDGARRLAGCSALIAKGTLRDADLALAHSRRSDAYVGTRDFDRAIQDREAALKLTPADRSYKMRLSGAYQLRASTKIKSNRDVALADLDQAIRIDPSNYEAIIHRSAEYLVDRNIDTAIATIEEAAKSDGQRAPYSGWLSALYVKRAVQRSLSNDFQGTISDYSKAIELDRNDPTLLLSRGTAYASKKDHGLAIQDFSEAIRLRQDYFDAHLARGETYRQKGELSRSLSDFNEAVRLDSKNVNALLGRALAAEASGSFEAARADYAKVLALDSKQVIAKAGFARAREAQEAAVRLERLSSEQSRPAQVPSSTGGARCAHGGAGCYRNGVHTCDCE